MKNILNQQSIYLLVLLIAADLAFIILGSVYECGILDLTNFCSSLNLNGSYSLTEERGYAEIFQHIKEYWLIILFGLLLINRQTKIYLGWFVFSIYLLLDDAFEIHETVGQTITQPLNFVRLFDLRPQDYGELLFFAVVGGIFFIWISWSYRNASSTERNNFKSLIFLLLAGAFFAVFVDVFHVMFDKYAVLKSFLGLVEDGGEHIVMSLIVALVLSITINPQPSKKSANPNDIYLRKSL